MAEKQQAVVVVALKPQTIEGGVVVQPGDVIPPDVASRIGQLWFTEGYVGFAGVAPEEEVRRRAEIDAKNRMIDVGIGGDQHFTPGRPPEQPEADPGERDPKKRERRNKAYREAEPVDGSGAPDAVSIKRR